MKTTAIMNLKGGVAKTITAVNMAMILAEKHGKRVLLIDADHQGNSSSYFPNVEHDYTLLDMLLGEGEHLWSDNVSRTGVEGLDLIPANMNLAWLDVANDSDAKERSRQIFRLREFLECAAEDDAYDHVFIDMPPSFSTAAKAALVAADEVIIPMKIDAFSLKGMTTLMEQIATMRKINERLRIAGVLMTMCQNAETVEFAKNALDDHNIPVFRSTIRWTKGKVDDSTIARKPLHVYSPRCAAARGYIRFAEEYLGGEGNG